MSVREFKLDNNAQRNPDNGTYVSHLTPAEYSKVVGLVGKRCMVHCQLNGQKVHSLWDTGAQVSLISKKWLDEHLPDLPLRNIESTPGILHAKTIIRSETIFFATARIILEPGREFNY